MSKIEYPTVKASTIPKVNIKGKQLALIMDEMISIIKHFFSSPNRLKIPFRGFLLEGPPGTGKTELVKQVARIVGNEIKRDVYFILIDSADIAAAKWGEAERKIKYYFNAPLKPEERLIILIDDIDCLMIKRGANVAVEWHYSINSILFHELDKIDPTNMILIATSNRTDLIDDALRSRLYFYNVKDLTLDDLNDVLEDVIKNLSIDEKYEEKLKKRVYEYLLDEKSSKSPNIRDIQHYLTKVYIREMLKKNGTS